MDEEVLEDLKKAGKIASEALSYAKSLTKPDASLLDIAEKTEKKILDLGGKLAFPVQISLNDVAAHYCPDADDKTILKDQLVSIDVGVHVNGYIGDTALTVDLSRQNEQIVKASEQALKKAISIIKPGIELAEIGREIQKVISEHGFAPIRNLSGHGLSQFNVHTAPTIPNYDNGDSSKLDEDLVIAIEPFASMGAGVVYESSHPTIFQLIRQKPVRSAFAREIMREIQTYNELPFAKRWLVKKFSLPKVNFALKELKSLEILGEFPPLIDQNHGLVSQAEHTIIVKDKPIVLTKRD